MTTKIYKAETNTDTIAAKEGKKTKSQHLDLENQSLAEEEIIRRCCHGMYPYGKKTTLTTLMISLFGLMASIMTKRSTSFVALYESLAPPDIIYLPTYSLGLFRVQLCAREVYNSSIIYRENEMPSSSLNYNNTSDDIFRRHTQEIADIFFPNNRSSCEFVRLQGEEVGDRAWGFARLTSTIAIYCGAVMVFWIVLSCRFRKVNIRAVAALGLFTYFFQSLTFIFYSSKVCDDLGCRLSSGGFICVVATICWLSAFLCTIQMYNHQKNIMLDLGYQRHIEPPHTFEISLPSGSSSDESSSHV